MNSMPAMTARAYHARLAQLRTLWQLPETPVDVDDRHVLQMPIVADLAAASADLLFGEPLAWADDRLADLANASELSPTLLGAAEQCAALGGVWMRVMWDAAVSPHPLVQAISPEQVWATWRFGRPTAADIHLVTEDGHVHVEHHEPGLIQHRLHSRSDVAVTVTEWGSSSPPLGPGVPLDRSAETRGLPEELLLPERIPLLIYVPNITPGRYPNVGRADVEYLDGALGAMETTWTSWLRDVRLGRSRIIVPNEFLARRGRGRGASFDVEHEVFVGVDVGAKDIATPIRHIQPAIRASDHAATMTALMEQFVVSAGYSPESFGRRVSGVAETASALRLRERRTIRTVHRKQGHWKKALPMVMSALIMVDRWVFGRAWPTDLDVSPVFGDPALPSQVELANVAEVMQRAGASSIGQRVRVANPEMSETEVAIEVAQIEKEKNGNA